MTDKGIGLPAGSFTRLAAKLNREHNAWLPLWVHCEDTCNVAERLVREWLSQNAISVMAGSLNEQELFMMVRAAALLHDLGKATALFQSTLGEECPSLGESLRTSGIPLLTKKEIVQQCMQHFYHAQAGEAMLLMAGCPITFAEVIGAHHGKPWSEGMDIQLELLAGETWKDPRANAVWGSREQRDIWQCIQAECLVWMISLSGCESVRKLPELSQPMAMLLTGLVIMADWIASNEAYFPLLALGESDPGDMQIRAERGGCAIDLPPSWKPCLSDDPIKLSVEQFGFPPNAVQQAVMQTVRTSGEPGLFILEAPMGHGKTEAALLSADLFAQRGAGGIFFGLPTQATANAIFGRVEEWGEKQPETNRTSIRLAHGMADMNARYRALMSGTGVSSVEEDEGSERLVVHEWFRGSKQALLADFVVGTVDQVLMASLKQKHVMLRHLGLCGKVVIIDECHAYDAYMNQYLEETLRWLGSYQTPVIMLSATLPAERRAAFLAAYLNKSPRAAKRFMKEPWYQNLAYPVLTWTDSQEVKQQSLPFDGTATKVKITKLDHGDSAEQQAESVAKLLDESLGNGGCAAVVLNTVRRAQVFAEYLRSALPNARILLLHSRYLTADRLEHENELLHYMGKQSGSEQRNRVIVVGTQVIEQSLDFDADIMVSDLCPMDLLMQRLGRLHRHRKHDAERPPALADPKCYVLCAGEKLDRGGTSVYGEYLLMRTRAFLPEEVCLPSDIPRLVNDVYDEQKSLSPEPPGYLQAREASAEKEDTLKNGARSFRIHDPDKDYFCNLLEGNIPADDEHARAQVRAGDLSMDVLLLMHAGWNAVSLLSEKEEGETWKLDTCPSEEDCRKLLAQRISFSAGLLMALQRDMTWNELLARLAIPEAWEASPWMKRSHMLMLDQQQQARIGGVILTYSKEIGLQWRKDGESV